MSKPFDIINVASHAEGFDGDGCGREECSVNGRVNCSVKKVLKLPVMIMIWVLLSPSSRDPCDDTRSIMLYIVRFYDAFSQKWIRLILYGIGYGTDIEIMMFLIDILESKR